MKDTFKDHLGSEWKLIREQYSEHQKENGYWCRRTKFASGLKLFSIQQVWFSQRDIKAYHDFEETEASNRIQHVGSAGN